jgi:hypothetical protein
MFVVLTVCLVLGHTGRSLKRSGFCVSGLGRLPCDRKSQVEVVQGRNMVVKVSCCIIAVANGIGRLSAGFALPFFASLLGLQRLAFLTACAGVEDPNLNKGAFCALSRMGCTSKESPFPADYAAALLASFWRLVRAPPETAVAFLSVDCGVHVGSAR